MQIDQQIDQEMIASPAELRSSPRTMLRRPAQIKDRDITLMYAITTDVSNGGLGLMAPNPMREGHVFAIAFDVRNDGKTKTISIGGTVTHCVKGAKGYKTGIRMVNDVH